MLATARGSVTKRLWSSTTSKAYGSTSCHGMDCALSISASALADSATSLRVLHCLVLWTGIPSNLFVTLPLPAVPPSPLQPAPPHPRAAPQSQPGVGGSPEGEALYSCSMAAAGGHLGAEKVTLGGAYGRVEQL